MVAELTYIPTIDNEEEDEANAELFLMKMNFYRMLYVISW